LVDGWVRHPPFGEVVDMFEPVAREADAAAAEMREQLRNMLMAIRLLRQQHVPLTTPIPAGMAGLLGSIDSLGDDRSAGCHVKDLAARNALDPSTVSRAVAALVRFGLVRRSPDPTDGRASVLELTESGRVARADTDRRYDALVTGALAGWSRQDFIAFSAMLHRFSADILAHLGKGPGDSAAGAQDTAELNPQQPILEAAR
jgi:DNA-binding MarR family transcriptional regulator